MLQEQYNIAIFIISACSTNYVTCYEDFQWESYLLIQVYIKKVENQLAFSLIWKLIITQPSGKTISFILTSLINGRSHVTSHMTKQAGHVTPIRPVDLIDWLSCANAVKQNTLSILNCYFQNKNVENNISK